MNKIEICFPDGTKVATEIEDQYILAKVLEILRSNPSKETPRINAMFETRSDCAVGTTSVPVNRVELQDDGSFTAVLDYWPPVESQKRVVFDKKGIKGLLEKKISERFLQSTVYANELKEGIDLALNELMRTDMVFAADRTQIIGEMILGWENSGLSKKHTEWKDWPGLHSFADIAYRQIQGYLAITANATDKSRKKSKS